MIRRESFDDFEQMLPHLDAAYNLARWLVRDPSTAEDVVQETYLRALKYFASFRGGSGRTWLLQIVRNVAYSHLNSQRSRMEVSLHKRSDTTMEEGADLELPDPNVGPEATLMHRQELAQLSQALKALPIQLRECVILRELEELSYRDIAKITGVPIGTVMSRLSRGRQALSKAAVASQPINGSRCSLQRLRESDARTTRAIAS
jgi:RNA polymerase sigma-70 factor, ECF subfamily